MAVLNSSRQAKQAKQLDSKKLSIHHHRRRCNRRRHRRRRRRHHRHHHHHHHQALLISTQDVTAIILRYSRRRTFRMLKTPSSTELFLSLHLSNSERQIIYSQVTMNVAVYATILVEGNHKR